MIPASYRSSLEDVELWSISLFVYLYYNHEGSLVSVILVGNVMRGSSRGDVNRGVCYNALCDFLMPKMKKRRIFVAYEVPGLV